MATMTHAQSWEVIEKLQERRIVTSDEIVNHMHGWFGDVQMDECIRDLCIGNDCEEIVDEVLGIEPEEESED